MNKENKTDTAMPPKMKERVDALLELISPAPWSKRGDLIVRLTKAVMDDKHEQVKAEIREELSCLTTTPY